MARILGNPAAVSGTSQTAVARPVPALRATRPGWRDPRLWIGIAIVAACIVAGSRVLGSADDTVAVWAVKADAGAGAVLGRSDLEAHRVHFAAAGDLAGYFRADADLPGALALTRGVGRGELLPRSAVATRTSPDTVQLPLAVDPGQIPMAVSSGSVVDVYVIGAARAGSTIGTTAGDTGAADRATGPGRGTSAASPALSAVTVVSAPRTDDVFGSSQTKRQLTLAVPEKVAQQFFGLLTGLDDPTVTVVLRPAG